ncbi:hypothetical protein [Solimonas soli]|uniref:hypothetical protein n=1 Tax=Solimonas soli TaxID=413479 RepID=UPI0004804F24|nr:hypothetical protein [Solimonas soli]
MTTAARRSCARSFSRFALAAAFTTLSACGGDHGNGDGAPPTDARLHCAPEPGDTTLAQACSTTNGAAS